MKIVFKITVILAVLFFSSCSKTEKMDAKLIFTLDGSFEPKTTADYERKFTWISDLEVDKEGNIYLFYPRLERILKYSSNGDFIKYFGSKGTGKGEFLNAMDFAIHNDTLYIKNTYTDIIIRNTLEGELIDYFEDNTGKFGLGENLRSLSENKFIGYVNMSSKNEEGVTSISNKLSIMSEKLEEIAILREYSTELDREDPKYFEFITKYAVGGGNIYVAENQEEKYTVSVYDLEGNKSGEISKDYKKISYNQEEVKKIKYLPISIRKTRDEMDTLNTKVTYKKSINNIFYDKYGRLLVCASVKRTRRNHSDFIADIFENGKFIKTITIPQLKGEDFLHRFDTDIYFIGDRIYEVLLKEMKVNVYEY